MSEWLRRARAVAEPFTRPFTRNQMRLWRVLNCTAALLLLSAAALWGWYAYTAAHFPRAQFFVLSHLLIYSTTAIFFALRAHTYTRVDALFAFGTAALLTLLQVGVLAGAYPGTIGHALFALAAYYLGAALYVQRRETPSARKLFEAFGIIAILLLVLTPYFLLQGLALAAVWGAKGGLLVWSGVYEKRWVTGALGVMVLTLAALGLASRL